MFLFVFCYLLSFCVAFLPETVEIDLSDDPYQIWKPSVKTILDIHGWEYSFGPVFKAHNKTLFNNIEEKVFIEISETVKTFWPDRYKELMGMSQAFAEAGEVVTVEYLCAWLYFHELAHTDWEDESLEFKECTGILAKQEKKILHGRNMDNTPYEIRNITLHHIWKMKGNKLFESVTWYWFNAGFVTGVKGGVITLEENWRTEKITKDYFLESMKNGTLPQPWFFRDALLDYSTSFDAVVKFLEDTPVIVGMYLIASGADDGVIITRAAGTKKLKKYYLSETPENFLVQTNHDRWEPDPIKDNRRTIAENLLREFSSFNELKIFNVLSACPVRNHGTAYSCVMNFNETMRENCFAIEPIK